jgi:hypothetical protein
MLGRLMSNRIDENAAQQKGRPESRPSPAWSTVPRGGALCGSAARGRSLQRHNRVVDVSSIG